MTSPVVLLSVVICTRDRIARLDQALASLTACAVPAGLTWEVLVIDNGSAQSVSTLVEQYVDRLPIRCVNEPLAGLSHARNRGAQSARGRWLIWIDDDVTVGQGWLAAYVRAMHVHPTATVLGGPIHPRLEGAPMQWLTHGLAWVGDAYAAREADEFRGEFGVAGAKPYGANFATRTDATRRFPFRTDLGRHPLRPAGGGEELDVIRRILAAEGIGHWVPDAPVTHHIGAERQTERYLRDYFVAAGSMAAAAWVRRGAMDRAKLLARSAVLWLRHTIAGMVRRLLGRDARRALDIRESAWHRGYFGACLRQLTRGSTG